MVTELTKLQAENRSLKAQLVKLHQRANCDELTGLYRRERGIELLSEMIAAQQSGCLAVVFIDLDNFKQINDDMGHLVGDDAIRYFANQLREVCSASGLAGCITRFGGDEFIVSLAVESASQVEEWQRLLSYAIENTPYKPIVGISIRLRYSLGIALLENSHNNVMASTTALKLIHSADCAMYKKKQKLA